MLLNRLLSLLDYCPHEEMRGRGEVDYCLRSRGRGGVRVGAPAAAAAVAAAPGAKLCGLNLIAQLSLETEASEESHDFSMYMSLRMVCVKTIAGSLSSHTDSWSFQRLAVNALSWTFVYNSMNIVLYLFKSYCTFLHNPNAAFERCVLRL